jgi:hypothetical protein
MTDYLIDNKEIYNFEYSFINYFHIITIVSFILFIVGFFDNKPFEIIHFFIKIILALFLIYRFNNYRKNKIRFTELDRKIGYSSGVYIITISFIDFFTKIENKIRNAIIPYTSPYVNYSKSFLPNLNVENHKKNIQNSYDNIYNTKIIDPNQKISVTPNY